MRSRFENLRLLADDLTGALDSAVAFVPSFGPLEVGLEMQDGASLVVNSATRECSAFEAASRVRTLAPVLQPETDRLCFFKVDSQLRGHAGTELATLIASNRFARTIVAPALPSQGRLTRNGRQVLHGEAIGENIAARLYELGHEVRVLPPGPPADYGITLFDAETDADLDCIVHHALPLDGPTLWVGTGGLAAALGRALPIRKISRQKQPEWPLLGLIGTNNPITKRQLQGVPTLNVASGALTASTISDIQSSMIAHGALFVFVEFAHDVSRVSARQHISLLFAEILANIAKPGTLFATGGETLRALLAPLGARALRVHEEYLPGIPLSYLVNGRWDGLPVLTKSGAFGDPHCLEALVDRTKPDGKALA